MQFRPHGVDLPRFPPRPVLGLLSVYQRFIHSGDLSMRNGPFGLGMGIAVSDIDSEVEEVAPGKYRVVAVPKPHSAFAYYILQITPTHGLSWIRAIGHTIQTSVYGIELKSSFDAMKAKLAGAYGKHNASDFLMRDSIWNEPREWMQALIIKERFLMADWEAKYGSSLRDSLTSVVLVAQALTTDSGYLAVEYSFSNTALAEAELAAAEDDAL
jgi:hypothetical protein